MKQITDEEARDVLGRGITLVGETFMKHSAETVPMMITGLMAVCSQLGTLELLKESFTAAVATINVMQAAERHEMTTLQ